MEPRTLAMPLRQAMLAAALSFGAATSPLAAEIQAGIKLHADNGRAAVTPPITGFAETGATKVSDTLVLTVTCEANVMCANVTATVGSSGNLTPDNPSTTARKFTVQKSTLPTGGASLNVLYQGNAVRSFDLVPESSAGVGGRSGGGSGDTDTTTLQEALQCDPAGVSVPDYIAYDRANNQAWFIVSPLGTIINGPNGASGEVIDENDTVKITLLVNKKLKPFLRVKRTSAARTLGGFAVAGEGTQLQRFASVPKCEPYDAYLRDFAPGTGTVKISAQIGEKETETGSFDFSVATLYRGMLSFGALTSDRVNDSFKLAPSNGQNVIVPGTEGSKQTDYAIWYTAFVWGRRDLEKPETQWYHHINPSLGFVTDHPGDHALAGISVDWNGFLFTVGKHYARATVLSSGSKLKEGDVFAGAATDIPTARKWQSSTYYAVSIDIRAAAAALKSVVTGTTGK